MISYVRHHPLRLVLIVLGGVLLGVFAFVWTTFRGLTSDEFDPEAAGRALAARSQGEVAADRNQLTDAQRQLIDQLAAQGLATLELEESLLANRGRGSPSFTNPHSESPPLPDDMFDAYLGIGADASGALADTLILVLVPRDGTKPMMISLPRDLYVQNPCTRGWSRINSGLGGCRGLASGPELLALMVQTFTGIEIDHTARVTFDGFMQLVNVLGGTTVCVDNATRDPRSGLDLPPGCTQADGLVTLAWARSRHTEQLIDGVWQQVAGSDFARQQRQQDILFQLAGQLTNFSSLGALIERVSAVSSAVRLDSSWSIGDAAGVAWQYRGIGRGDVSIFSVGVRNYRTAAGAAVLLPNESFNQALARVYPSAAR